MGALPDWPAVEAVREIADRAGAGLSAVVSLASALLFVVCAWWIGVGNHTSIADLYVAAPTGGLAGVAAIASMLSLVTHRVVFLTLALWFAAASASWLALSATGALMIHLFVVVRSSGD